eukprot:TRINITY_DN106237_c0_g1_i1.p1 TRINITY_DN106237_c0_g1~~TRINITY_DN106237_c0_g1_i1.p1  ORF type:complete len:810 (-),score=109.75 TRINITY_DN106237_c0_g1_i1:128-2557(-)
MRHLRCNRACIAILVSFSFPAVHAMLKPSPDVLHGRALLTGSGTDRPEVLAEFHPDSVPVSKVNYTDLDTHQLEHQRPHQLEHHHMLNESSFWTLSTTVVVGLGLLITRFDRVRTAQSDEQQRNQGFDVSHFLVCAFALTGAQLLWGLAQEFIMTQDSTGSSGTTYFCLFLVLCNRLCTTGLTGTLLGWQGQQLVFPGFESASLPALSNIVASWSQYASLSYISFSLQTTGKSAKLVPVFLISILRGSRYNAQDAAEVAVLCGALTVFGLETIGHDSYHQGTGEIGVSILAMNILSDALTPHLQDIMYKKHPSTSALQATFATSLFSLAGLATVLVCTGTMFEQISLLSSKENGFLHLSALTISSAMVQYMVNYTIKHFGPVVFMLLVTMRQGLSVLISSDLFHHEISFLGYASLLLVFGTLLVRAVRKLLEQRKAGQDDPSPSGAAGELLAHRTGNGDTFESMEHSLIRVITEHSLFTLCLVSIMMSLGVESIIMEFFTVHTFQGVVFAHPVALCAMYKTVGACAMFLLAWATKGRGNLWPQNASLVTLPGITRDVATLLQYQAIFLEPMPAIIMMKSLKVIPTMLIGTMMKTRKYSLVDYVEAVMVTAMVALFVWDFHHVNAEVDDAREVISKKPHMIKGAILIGGYVCLSAFSCNFEDYVYQVSSVMPFQQTLWLEILSMITFWLITLASGDMAEVLAFLAYNQEVLGYICVLGITTAVATYVLTISVKFYGPSVTAGVLVARQLMSLVLSVGIFNHKMNYRCCICLSGVSMLLLASCVRQINRHVRPGLKKAEEVPEGQDSACKE